jgi:hypothetical protein
MVKRIRIDMSDRLFYTLVVVGLTILSVAVVYGYGTFEPAVFGHSLGELNLGVYDCDGDAITKIDFGTGTVTCTGSGPGLDLIYGIHSSEQCTNLGGTVVDAGAGDICRFTASSCRAGWTQYGSWSTTTSNTATCDNSYIYFFGQGDEACGGGTATTCDTGSHVFSNVARESCTVTASSSRYCIACTTTSSSASATITEVGCY